MKLKSKALFCSLLSIGLSLQMSGTSQVFGMFRPRPYSLTEEILVATSEPVSKTESKRRLVAQRRHNTTTYTSGTSSSTPSPAMVPEQYSRNPSAFAPYTPSVGAPAVNPEEILVATAEPISKTNGRPVARHTDTSAPTSASDTGSEQIAPMVAYGGNSPTFGMFRPNPCNFTEKVGSSVISESSSSTPSPAAVTGQYARNHVEFATYTPAVGSPTSAAASTPKKNEPKAKGKSGTRHYDTLVTTYTSGTSSSTTSPVTITGQHVKKPSEFAAHTPPSAPKTKTKGRTRIARRHNTRVTTYTSGTSSRTPSSAAVTGQSARNHAEFATYTPADKTPPVEPAAASTPKKNEPKAKGKSGTHQDNSGTRRRTSNANPWRETLFFGCYTYEQMNQMFFDGMLKNQIRAPGEDSLLHALNDLGVSIDYVYPEENKRNTHLHYAVSLGYTRLIDSIIAKGGRPDAVNSDGRTPLHIAAMSQYFKYNEHGEKGEEDKAKNAEVMQHLLVPGISKECLDARDNSGKTAYKLALENHNYDVANLLARCGANTSI